MRMFRLALAAVVLPAALGAQVVVYDNGTPNNNNAYKASDRHRVADDFFLTSAENVSAFRIHLVNLSNPVTLSGNLDWTVRTGGLTGAILGSGLNVAYSGNPTIYGCCAFDPFAYNDYLVEFSTGGLLLGPGTYWLSIGGGAEDTEVYWSESGPGNARQESLDFPGWGDLERDVAFQVVADGDPGVVPEPSTIVLTASGLIGVIVAARKRKRTNARG